MKGMFVVIGAFFNVLALFLLADMLKGNIRVEWALLVAGLTISGGLCFIAAAIVDLGEKPS